jgi:hypothetical protein
MFAGTSVRDPTAWQSPVERQPDRSMIVVELAEVNRHATRVP